MSPRGLASGASGFSVGTADGCVDGAARAGEGCADGAGADGAMAGAAHPASTSVNRERPTVALLIRRVGAGMTACTMARPHEPDVKHRRSQDSSGFHVHSG